MTITKVPPASRLTVTVEIFAKDLWEAMRQELREQVGPVADFDRMVPTWDELSAEVRHEKVQSVRNEVLKPITRAGYEIRQKI